MDLSTLDAAENTAVMEVRHPATLVPIKHDDGSEDGAPVTITLYSIDSPQYEKAQRDAQNRRLRQRNRQPITAEEIKAEGLTTLAACVRSWKNIELDGASLECTKDNAKKLFGRLPWLREQVDEFIAERGNFLKASA